MHRHDRSDLFRQILGAEVHNETISDLACVTCDPRTFPHSRRAGKLIPAVGFRLRDAPKHLKQHAAGRKTEARGTVYGIERFSFIGLVA